jgi:hypothetical protein
MKKLLYNLILIAGIGSATLITSCKKDIAEDTTATTFRSGGDSGPSIGGTFINRNLLVSLALDNGNNITANFAGITFMLLKTSENSGTVKAFNDLMNVDGSWAMNGTGEGSSITFSFPTDRLPQLAFLNQQWLINSMSDEIDLTSADGSDVLHFSGK